MVYDRIAKVAKQFLGVHVMDAGFVPSDPEVPAAVRRRTPFLLANPRCPASRYICQLAMRLEQGVTPGVDAGGGGFFNRMSRWFRR